MRKFLEEKCTKEQRQAFLYFTYLKEEGAKLAEKDVDAGLHIVARARVLEFEWWESARETYALPQYTDLDTHTSHFYVVG